MFMCVVSIYFHQFHCVTLICLLSEITCKASTLYQAVDCWLKSYVFSWQQSGKHLVRGLLICKKYRYIATRKVPMQKTCHADTEKTSDYLISLLVDACLTFLRVREVKRRVYIAAKKCPILYQR